MLCVDLFVACWFVHCVYCGLSVVVLLVSFVLGVGLLLLLLLLCWWLLWWCCLCGLFGCCECGDWFVLVCYL